MKLEIKKQPDANVEIQATDEARAYVEIKSICGHAGIRAHGALHLELVDGKLRPKQDQYGRDHHALYIHRSDVFMGEVSEASKKLIKTAITEAANLWNQEHGAAAFRQAGNVRAVEAYNAAVESVAAKEKELREAMRALGDLARGLKKRMDGDALVLACVRQLVAIPSGVSNNIT
jgi:hypothetical protein